MKLTSLRSELPRYEGSARWRIQTTTPWRPALQQDPLMLWKLTFFPTFRMLLHILQQPRHLLLSLALMVSTWTHQCLSLVRSVYTSRKWRRRDFGCNIQVLISVGNCGDI